MIEFGDPKLKEQENAPASTYETTSTFLPRNQEPKAKVDLSSLSKGEKLLHLKEKID